MAPALRSRRGGLLLPLLVAVAAATFLGASLLSLSAGFVPPARLPLASQRVGVKGQLEAAGSGAEEAPLPPPGPSRSVGLRGTLLAAFAALVGVAGAGVGAARAYELESNRVATYQGKARQLNEAVDWYLFEVRPLIYPAQELMEMSSCEEFGDRCAERAGLSVIYDMYQGQGAVRGGGQIVVSKLERDLFTPMKLLAMSSVFDPDTEDDLQGDVQKMEIAQNMLARAAKKGDLVKVKQLYGDGQNTFNSYFKKVNAQTSLPEKSEYYLMPIPSVQEVETDKYWVRRKEKYMVKKKVDAVSKGNKTARFYAKSLFGDDAVSWDPRGDRADEFFSSK